MGRSVLLSFGKSDHTFGFGTLKKGLSCHRAGMKNFGNFPKGLYNDDNVLRS